MAEKSRRRGKTTYEKICDTRNKIKNTEERLVQLNQELDNLYETFSAEFTKQNEIEMRKIFDAIGKKRINIEDLLKLLDE